jgi:protein-tyrosine phosphatase
MEKILNFRDVGGMQTEDGRKVKTGLFFRCAMPDEASEKDLEELRSLGIKLVFDYRDPDEVTKTEFPYEAFGAKHMAFPMLNKEDKLYRLQKKSNLRRAFSHISPEDVKQTYRRLPFHNEGYKAMVQALVDGEVPFIQHCTAGKDRTGLGIAILLSILGVSFKDIMEDYLLSIQMVEEMRKRIEAQLPRFLIKWADRRFGFLLSVQAGYLEAALDEIQKRYGDLYKYAEAEFGLSREDIRMLRDRYTE